MPTYELIAFETSRESGIRYRAYTTNRRKAEAFGKIQRIDLTSGHGIVFSFKTLLPYSKRDPACYLLRDYVREELERIGFKAKRRQRAASASHP